MARTKITVTSNNVQTQLQGSGFAAIDKLLDIAAPETKKLLEYETNRILQTARDNWLVRGLKPRTPEQHREKVIAGMTKSGKYTLEEAITIADKMGRRGIFTQQNSFAKSQKSQDSKGKLRLEISINQNFEIVVRLKNDAPYAWAIRTGEASIKTIVPYGKRISEELLWKPMVKISDKITKQLANDIVKLI